MGEFELREPGWKNWADIQPLGRVWWPSPRHCEAPVPVEGAVPMLDVQDAGELREWGA